MASYKENPTKYYETFSPYVDQVAFNPLIDYLWNDIKDNKEIPYMKISVVLNNIKE